MLIFLFQYMNDYSNIFMFLLMYFLHRKKYLPNSVWTSVCQNSKGDIPNSFRSHTKKAQHSVREKAGHSYTLGMANLV